MNDKGINIKIDKTKLLTRANQMLLDQRILTVDTAEVSTEKYLHNRGILIGIEKIIKLIEEQ